MLEKGKVTVRLRTLDTVELDDVITVGDLDSLFFHLENEKGEELVVSKADVLYIRTIAKE